jgi:O-6-methylguanine DNA methyltransferase
MDFSGHVLGLAARIPAGRVSTYGELAKALGGIRFSRAVGSALNRNPHPVAVPCHRVVYSGGRVGGYVCGVAEKIRLLSEEGVIVAGGRVLDFEEKLVTVDELLRP